MEETKIPSTLDEAIQMMIEADANPNPNMFNMMGMRNGWGLWNGSKLAQWFYKHLIYHADDMSSIIVDSYKRVKNGKDIKLNDQIAKYHKHWAKYMGDDHLNKMKQQVIEHLQRIKHEDLKEIIKLINS